MNTNKADLPKTPVTGWVRRGVAKAMQGAVARTAMISMAMLLLGGVVGGGVGHRWGSRSAVASSGNWIAPRGYVAPREYYDMTATFSEVAMAKGELGAMAVRYVADLESRVGSLHGPRTAGWIADGALSADRVELAIRELRAGMVEFEGTAQESTLRQHLLAVLRRWERHEEWVTTYLDLAYRHPTDPLVGRLAGQAVRISMILGRQGEVQEALDRIAGIPVTFEAKAAVHSILGRRIAGMGADAGAPEAVCL